MSDLENLVSGAEIARRLGVSKQRAHQLTHMDGFPEPLGRLGAAIVWRWSDVAAWSEESGLPRPPRETQPPGTWLLSCGHEIPLLRHHNAAELPFQRRMCPVCRLARPVVEYVPAHAKTARPGSGDGEPRAGGS